MNEEITLIFYEDSKPLNLDDLGNFIFLFKSVYLVAFEELQPISVKDFVEKQSEYVNRIVSKVSSDPLSKISNRFEQNTSKQLEITRIKKESALEIVMYGCAVALVAAAVISGGKIELLGLKATLNPLGDGIKKLRNAFKFRGAVTTGYSVKIAPVKLSDDEYKRLMKPARGQGGFQNLFAELQNRIDKKTKYLELYPSDIDKIKRHGREPEKGGFQLQLKKIFERHLDLK